jgi:Integrase core domain
LLEPGVELRYIATGEPQRSAFFESFNGPLRDELPTSRRITQLCGAGEPFGLVTISALTEPIPNREC